MFNVRAKYIIITKVYEKGVENENRILCHSKNCIHHEWRSSIKFLGEITVNWKQFSCHKCLKIIICFKCLLIESFLISVNAMFQMFIRYFW
jgi:hypothetical protein